MLLKFQRHISCTHKPTPKKFCRGQMSIVKYDEFHANIFNIE